MITEQQEHSFLKLALSAYQDEPCRICGKPVTMADLEAGAVFAGYNADNTSRSAHKHCWDEHGKDGIK